jgi:hypothetical protein
MKLRLMLLMVNCALLAAWLGKLGLGTKYSWPDGT